MSLMVKICGLKSADDVTAAVEAGANAVGFVFAESKRRVTPTQAGLAGRAAPEGVLRVAVMLHPHIDEWLDVLHTFEPDVLQTDSEDFARLKVPPQVKRWPVYREGGVLPDGSISDTFVYEGRSSGQGQTVDWSRAAGIADRGQMILAGGLDSENLAEAVRTVRPFGIDASSAVESAPGTKDPQRIHEFVTAARAAEQHL